MDTSTLTVLASEYIQTCGHLDQINTTARELRTKKKKLGEQMTLFMRDNDTRVQLRSGGELCHVVQSYVKPMTEMQLLQILSKHPNLSEEQIVSLNKFIQANRETTKVDKIIMHKRSKPIMERSTEL